MTDTLKSIDPALKKARNFSYFGMYEESVKEFHQILGFLSQNILKINDLQLKDYWNRLVEEVQYQKSVVENMIDILAGNEKKEKKTVTKKPQYYEEQPRMKVKPEQPRYQRFQQNERPIEDKKSKLPFGKTPFNLKYYEEDSSETRADDRNEREQREERERIQRQKQFEERDAEIWPKKPVKPAKKSYQPSYQPQLQSKGNKNKSVVSQSDKRDYEKPWQANTNKGKQDEGDKKSFLKNRYPNGDGPDTNLIEMLENEVVDKKPTITFEDIAELQKAKNALQMAILLPLKFPEKFKGLLKPCRGVLLFGPPGTGKTLLAKAIASSGCTTFFNVSASSLASKWRGESEKLVRILFEMAEFYAPSTIFIDEIDSLASKRSQKQDEANRKVKTQLMTRLDGVSKDDEKSIVLIGATNRPWDLDQAIRRRLQKRIYIPLPSEVGRKKLLEIILKNEVINDVNIDQIAKKTQGYSGADISILCRQAGHMTIQKILERQGSGLDEKLKDKQWIKKFDEETNLHLTMQNFRDALEIVKPSVSQHQLKDYDVWMNQFGQSGNIN